MVKISKQERDYLESKGFSFGEFLHRTYGKNKTYYATESKNLMKVLNNFRKKSIIYSSDKN